MTSSQLVSPQSGVAQFAFGMIAYAGFLALTLRWRPGAASPWPIPGYGFFDAGEMLSALGTAFTHYSLVQAAVDARTGVRGSPWPAATAFRFGMAEAINMVGHGMHVVANGLEAARDNVYLIDAEEQVSPTSMFVYFSHDMLGHKVQYTGLMLIVATAIEAEGGVGATPSFFTGWVLPALLSAAYAPLSIGTRTAVMVTPFMLTCIMLDLKTTFFGAASGGYVRTFFQRTALFTLAVYAAHCWQHGGAMPTTNDLAGKHVNVRDRVFESMGIA